MSQATPPPVATPEVIFQRAMKHKGECKRSATELRSRCSSPWAIAGGAALGFFGGRMVLAGRAMPIARNLVRWLSVPLHYLFKLRYYRMIFASLAAGLSQPDAPAADESANANPAR